ncbi:MAG: GntR family transcriptional regulator [Hyphomicrobiaceae bacterium]
MGSISTHMTDERLPLYQRVRDSLAAGIADGAWKAGAPIPSEQKLAGEFGVALGTVRRAITELVDEGLLERRQGKGTFVRTAEFRNSLFRFFRFRADDGAEILPEGRLLERRVEKASPEIAQYLDIRSGARVIYLHRLRVADGAPLVVEHLWLPHDLFNALDRIADADWDDLLYPMYERVCGHAVARARDHLTLGRATGNDARQLKLKSGSPVVQIERTAYGLNDRPLEWRRSLGNAELFSYTVDLK